MVSIIVPVYNAAEYIRKTIEMVQAQTFTDWELLLVDDGSKDNSEEVIRTYLKEKPDERIRLIKKEKNGEIKYIASNMFCYLDNSRFKNC